MTDLEQNHVEEISVDELLYWGEFACWTVLVLWPFLYFVNGPSVSTDQSVVRTGLVVIAAIGGVSLRAYKVISRRASRAAERER